MRVSKELLSRRPGGVDGLGSLSGFSYDLIGEVLGLLLELFSSIILMSRTEPVCMDCSLRCGPPTLAMVRSGDGSLKRLVGGGTWVVLFSFTRSVSAAWADWMALETGYGDVPLRVACFGDAGLSDARSESALSHLVRVS